MQDLLDEMGRTNERVHYAGRTEAASPAVGYAKLHEQQQKALVDEALATAKEAKALRRA